MPDLDPITGPAPATLTTALLAERLASERALREQGNVAFRELIKQHQDFVADNLRRQAAEYERRLADLNHAHEQAVEAAANTVPREVYDTYVRDQADKQALASTVVEQTRAALAKDVEIERNARIRLEGSMGTWRFIALFLGLPGVVGVFLGLIAVFGPKA